ncbi:protein Shroom2 [Aplysia californica]|uniref:Protein Shroom2 n=1 Tax=Aplysia californica TaxID=6500 RepID=A0ABM1A6B5_APLCA|nr:protein Shroom2 [Aplysia californica]
METHFGAGPDAPALPAPRWRPRRGPEIPPPPTPPTSGQGEMIEVHAGDQEFPPPPPEVLQAAAGSGEKSGSGMEESGPSTAADTDGFADESYIGHKNKSSRPIGTYKRSKSAAAIQSGSSSSSSASSSNQTTMGVNDNNSSNSHSSSYQHKVLDESENTSFPEKKLSGWNSESLLMQHADRSGELHGQTFAAGVGVGVSGGAGATAVAGGVNSIQEYAGQGGGGGGIGNNFSAAPSSSISSTSPPSSSSPSAAASAVAPARPARPSMTSRQAPPHSSSSSSSSTPASFVSFSSPSSSSSLSPNNNNNNNNNSKVYAADQQPLWGREFRESPRRQPPPPPASPPFDPSQSHSRNQHSINNNGHNNNNSNSKSATSGDLPWSPAGQNETPRGADHQSETSLPFSHYSPQRRPAHQPPALSEPGMDFSRKTSSTSFPSSNHNSTATTYNSNSNSNNNASSPHLSSSPSNYPAHPYSVATSSSPTSQDATYQRTGQQAPPIPPPHGEEAPPRTLPPRDYQRRESAPVRPVPVPQLSEPHDGLLEAPPSELARRKSESSVASTPRSEHNLSDVSGSSHSRQPSQEELECDQKAQELAQELADKEHKLSEVLRLDATKKRMQYMDGLFSESLELPVGPRSERSLSTSSTTAVEMRGRERNGEDGSVELSDSAKRSSLPKEYWVSPPKAMLEMEMRRNEDVGRDLTRDIHDNSALMKQKEELLGKLHKKLEVLKEAKVVLQQEISENNQLGMQVCKLVESRCQSSSERGKFKTYIEDLEKIVRLLLNLSGQLARAENAVQALAANADPKLKKMTIDKRERLHSKHEEAKLLKDDIDKRSEQLSATLRDRLEDSEFSDYSHYIKMKSKLTIELQELDDKITLGGEQIQELKKSIPDYGGHLDASAHR